MIFFFSSITFFIIHKYIAATLCLQWFFIAGYLVVKYSAYSYCQPQLIHEAGGMGCIVS